MSDGGLGDACGPTCGCGAGLVCVSDPYGQICRRATTPQSGCPDDETSLRLPGTRNPVLGSEGEAVSPYRVCIPCRTIAVDGLSLCGTADQCLADGGELARVDEDRLPTMTAALSVVQSEPRALVGAQRREDGAWVWGDTEEAVADVLWVDGMAPSEGDCAVLTAMGSLEPSSDCQALALCTRLARPGCVD